jgi:hypothetical protein
MALSKVTSYGVDLYKLKVNSGGAIDIDPGSSGTTTIRGNLFVVGDTTTITSTEIAVTDRTITVNNGEYGAGVTGITSGLIVDRGTLTDAELLYDELSSTYINGVVQSNYGAFVLRAADGNLSGLHVTSINSVEGNDLNFLTGQNVGVLSVTGTLDYEVQVEAGDDDVIPNKAYVDIKIANSIEDAFATIDGGTY